MKIALKKLLLAFFASVLLVGCFSMSSCSEKPVMTLEGGYSLESDVFEYIVSYCKTQEYTSLLNMLELAGEDTSYYDLTVYDFWDSEYGDDGKTLAEGVMEAAVVMGKSYLSAAKQFDKQGLTMETADHENIKTAMKELEENLKASGNVTLKEYLKEYGISLNTYKKVLTYQYKINKLLARLMAPGSKYEVSDDDVKLAYPSTVEVFGYSNVNHVFLYSVTFNSAGNPVDLSEEDYQKIKTKAEEIYDAVVTGQAEFEEFLSMSDDDYSPDGYLVDINTGMTEAFVSAAIDMEVGEVRLVESEGIGFHIIKKYELTDAQKTDIEDNIRENLEDEAEERILNVFFDNVEVDEEVLSGFDAVHAPILK